MKSTLILPLLLLSLTCGAEVPAGNPMNYLFEGGTEGYECFRIPAIVTTNSGTLLAFAEGRKSGCSDTGDIDLVMKRSTDQGLTWSKLVVIRDDGDNVCGNPAPVVDELTGVIHLLSTWNLGEDREHQIIDGTSLDTRRVFLMISENDGKTWELGGTTPQDQVNECTVAELSDGRLMLNMRNYDRSQKSRKIAFSKDGGLSWGKLTIDPTLIEPLCQASMLMVREREEGRHTLFFLNPAHEDERRMMTLRSSDDDGVTWKGSLVLHQGPAAYSDLCILSNDSLGCLYEAGVSTPYQGIIFQALSW